jgi:hypothetical protein
MGMSFYAHCVTYPLLSLVAPSIEILLKTIDLRGTEPIRYATGPGPLAPSVGSACKPFTADRHRTGPVHLWTGCHVN